MSVGARDFPFYQGRPARVSAGGWLLVLAGCAAGFLALSFLPHLIPGLLGRWLSILLFLGLPLCALATAADGQWAAIFHRPTRKDLLIGLAVAPLTLLTSAIVGLLVMHVSITAANPAVALLRGLNGLDVAVFLAGTAPQLLGEEIITLLPFLALLAVLARLGSARVLAVAAAGVATALLFGALHLPTYGWHVAQALLIIGAARLVLTGAYILTKNVWASFIAHLIHDWTLFAIVLALGA